jgi:TonB family protein
MSITHLNGQADEDKVYTDDQVDVKAKLKNKTENVPKQPIDCPKKLQVMLRIVLRKSGNVTNVRVVKSSGCSYDDEAVKAVQMLEFEPAIKAGHRVSQYLNFEYRVGDQ